MIKCLCKENVQDKFTGEDYVAGRVYGFTEERAAEVTSTKYFEYVELKLESKEVEIKLEEVEIKPTKKSVKKSANK